MTTRTYFSLLVVLASYLRQGLVHDRLHEYVDAGVRHIECSIGALNPTATANDHGIRAAT